MFCEEASKQNNMLSFHKKRSLGEVEMNFVCVRTWDLKKISSGLYSVCIIRSNISGENESPEDKLNWNLYGLK